MRDIQKVWEAATCGVTFAEVKTITTTIEEIATRETTKFLEEVTTATLAATEIGSSSNGQSNFQIEERLGIEIESIRRLMMKVP